MKLHPTFWRLALTALPVLIAAGCLPPAPMDGPDAFHKKGDEEMEEDDEDLLDPAFRTRPEDEHPNGSGPPPEDAPPQDAASGDVYRVGKRSAEETPGENDDLVDEAFVYFKSENYKKLKKLRKRLKRVHVREFVDVHWHKDLPWDVKNGFIHLLAERSEKGVATLMEEGLNSPAAHIRQTAETALARLRPSPVVAAVEAPEAAASDDPDPTPLQESEVGPAVLTPHWNYELPWELKDVFVKLLAEKPEDGANEVMVDALTAPNPETRATAIVFLSEGRYTRAKLLDGDALSDAKLDAAVEDVRAAMQR